MSHSHSHAKGLVATLNHDCELLNHKTRLLVFRLMFRLPVVYGGCCHLPLPCWRPFAACCCFFSSSFFPVELSAAVDYFVGKGAGHPAGAALGFLITTKPSPAPGSGSAVTHQIEVVLGSGSGIFRSTASSPIMPGVGQGLLTPAACTHTCSVQSAPTSSTCALCATQQGHH